MRSEEEIRRDVEAELRWDPRIDATDVAVTVSKGVATLAGFVHSYSAKFEAEQAVKRVTGVAAVANEIEVTLPPLDERSDPEIARDSVSALRSQLPLSADGIKTTVSHGWLTLEGSVEWNYQRDRADKALRRIRGVRGVSNLIAVKPRAEAQEVKHQIEEALKRSAAIDAENIRVHSGDGRVVLEGTVRSWVERQEAERAAWAAPGVTRVENRILVRL